MKDMRAQIDKLRKDGAECKALRELTREPKKRAFFERLSLHLNDLASMMEALLAKRHDDDAGDGGTRH
jgi:hypothetical protein